MENVALHACASSRYWLDFLHDNVRFFDLFSDTAADVGRFHRRIAGRKEYSEGGSRVDILIAEANQYSASSATNLLVNKIGSRRLTSWIKMGLPKRNELSKTVTAIFLSLNSLSKKAVA